jgi:UDP-sulfoquinovose synthase
MTETHRVRDLAALVAELTGARIAHVTNPRKEAAENDLVVENAQFLALGLEPTTLAQGLLEEVIDVARAHRDRVDLRRIPCVSAWTRDIEAALAAERKPRLEVANA